MQIEPQTGALRSGHERPLRGWGSRFVAGLLLIGVCAPVAPLLVRWARTPSVEAFSFVERLEPQGLSSRVEKRTAGNRSYFFLSGGTDEVRVRLRAAPGVSHPRRLWLSHGVADNHARVRFLQGDALVGELDNRRAVTPGEVAWVFEPVGVLARPGEAVTVELGRDDGTPFFTEIAGGVLAHPDASEEEVRRALEPLDPRAPLKLLGLLGGIWLACSAGFRRRSTRRSFAEHAAWGAIIAAPLLLTAALVVQNLRPNLPTAGAAYFLPFTFEEGPRTGWTEQLGDWISRTLARPFPYQSFPPQPSGLLSTEVFAKEGLSTLPLPSEAMLGGALAKAEKLPASLMHRWVALCLVVCGVAALGRSLAKSGWQARACTLVSLTAASCASIFVSLRISTGWDEFYINLRHALVFRDTGVFSYNYRALGEGTVDFLPFFLAGLLGKAGVHLEDAILGITLSGNVLCIVAGYLVCRRFTQSPVIALVVAAAVGLSPAVAYVGGTGFTAPLFAGWTVLGLYFLFLAPGSRVVGLVLLATLTLVRTEGIVFAALAFCVASLGQRRQQLLQPSTRPAAVRVALLEGVLLASPFLLSAVVRKLVFGSALPNPIQFKNSQGDLTYLAVGVSELLKYIEGFEIPLLLVPVIALGALLSSSEDPIARPRRQLFCLLAITGLGVLPYHLGGGDWFPWYWSRYQAPFTVAATVAFCSAGYVCLRRVLRAGWRPRVATAAALLLIGYAATGRSSQHEAYGKLWQDVTAPSTVGWWGRIDTLAVFGRFLKENTRSTAVIASPELATMMFHAERDLLDLLGIASPEVARTPLYPLRPGDRLHRKRNPDVLRRHLPEIIALYEPAFRTRRTTPPDRASLVEDVRLTSLGAGMVNVAYYRAGSYADLGRLGYRHLSVSLQDYVFQFFVHEREYPFFRESLLREGYAALGTGSIPYAFDDQVTSRFPSISGGVDMSLNLKRAVR